MQVQLILELPRQKAAVPALRHSAKTLLREIGVSRSVVDDLELALSEACGNVIRHAVDDDVFSVSLVLDGDLASVTVRNERTTLPGHARTPGPMPDHEAEAGRGQAIMAALVDLARFDTVDDAGAVVHLTTRVTAEPGSLLATSLAGMGARGDQVDGQRIS